eukprot:TRINITY_DN23744_c0_g3_i1.p1 TRINITY_DN23744_c0_g3~~TRINITY_DN23744_c0_g3_i1.p1  ORF type:complete len:736 (-),score=104.83 TRINITY_DN23744_c0_g3_i1:107-2314(-)
MTSHSTRKRVALLGSGNFGCAIAHILGENALALDDYEDRVNMYVYEEVVNGRNLTDIINSEHENVKYLPGHKLPSNVVAVPNAVEAAQGANVLVVCMPHQFLPKLLATVKDVIKPGAVAVSLIKGHIEIRQGRPVLGSKVINDTLGIETAVMMGANVANEIARGDFCEATLSCPNVKTAESLARLFHLPRFSVRATTDVPATELCGGLKNVIALGAGFCDGLGLGYNTKAAVIRSGLLEMFTFIQHFYPESNRSTLFESCGAADLITTCFGGRNRKCAEAFAKDPQRGWGEIEASLLGGQKLQGVSTVNEIWPLIEARRLQRRLPLIRTIYHIAMGDLEPKAIMKFAAHEGPPCPALDIQQPAIRVAVFGSGKRAVAVAGIMATNMHELGEFDDTLNMYVHDEIFEGRHLSDAINSDHENTRYLPGYKIPPNVVASTDAVEVARNADILVICVPRRHLPSLLSSIKPVVKPGAVAVSLIKGHGPGEVRDGQPLLASRVIQEVLGTDTAVLAGANVSHEVARGDFCEATLATNGAETSRVRDMLPLLFHRPNFQIRQVRDVAGTDMASTLNCVIGLAAGFCDGLGLGGNTKAAVIRTGLLEVAQFTSTFFPNAQRDTLFESCGVADLISISMSPSEKHRRGAEAFAKEMMRARRLVSKADLAIEVKNWHRYAECVWKDIEENELNRSCIWGVETLRTLWPLIAERGLQNELPLLRSLYRIVIDGDSPSSLLDLKQV